MDKEKFLKIKKRFEMNGGIIDSSVELDRLLDLLGAEATAIDKNTIIIRYNKIPSASAVFEEFIHTAQYRNGKITGNNRIDMEIEAKRKLIKYQKQYEIPDNENEATKIHIKQLLKMRKEIQNV